MRNHLAIVAILLSLSAVSPAAESLIWIEGEDAVKKQVFANAWYQSVDPDELSGGQWLASFSEPDKPIGTAEYRFTIEADGDYRLWLRGNVRGAGMAYRVDGGERVVLDFKAIRAADKAAMEAFEKAPRPKKTKGKDAPPPPAPPKPHVVQESDISLNGERDARFIAWLDAGTLSLKAGEHTIAFELGFKPPDAKADFKPTGALDCIVLAAGEFTPNTKFKPGEKGWEITQEFDMSRTWLFEPARDTFDAGAAFDLRDLNEKVAGEHGFIRRSGDGESFVRGDGQPIRFWGGSTYVQAAPFKKGWRGSKDGLEELAHHARFLAKRGVNVVRLHGHVPSKKPDSKITDVDPDAVEQIWRLVAAMKKEGIYTIISPYWGSHTDWNKNWGVPDPGTGTLAALVFFEPTVQAAYKAWLKAIYTPPNPHTGIPLAQDPAVAIIQLQNEDSMLFGTMQKVKGEPLKLLRRQYGEWLVRKYGSFEKAMEAWQGDKLEDDDFANGLPGMYIVWEFTSAARALKGSAPGREARLSDQLEFMAGTMRKFNSDMARYLRDELGCKHLINAGNWKTMDPILLEDSERWSYTANDVIGKNHYYSPPHQGFQRGYKITADHYYANWSATQRPTALPFNCRQVVGHPFIIPESLWVPPLLYQSEGPLMTAAQLSLTGVDTFYWFATGKEEWQEPGNKWTFATPMQLGQFPATALLFRKGYVKEGEPVVVEERSLQNLWNRKSPLIAEGGSFDPNRDTGDLPPDSSVKGGVDPLAFCVGPVKVKYGGDPAKSRVADLAPYIDKDRKIVRSVTGEIELDYGAGVYRVNAPKAQGAAGFLKAAGEIALKDVTIQSRNEYVTVVAVPLDDQPIASSRRVLVQIGTYCRPEGWQARPAKFQAGKGDAGDKTLVEGWRILSEGKSKNPRWAVANTDVTVSVRNPGLSKATLLDINGMAIDSVRAETKAGALTVTPPANAMYVMLE